MECSSASVGNKSVTMENKYSLKLKITDYFDIPHNSWSNEGIKVALNRAVVMCKNYEVGEGRSSLARYPDTGSL